DTSSSLISFARVRGRSPRAPGEADSRAQKGSPDLPPRLRSLQTADELQGWNSRQTLLVLVPRVRQPNSLSHKLADIIRWPPRQAAGPVTSTRSVSGSGITRGICWTGFTK